MSSLKLSGLLTEMEVKGVETMRQLNKEYLAKEKCSTDVKEFLEKAGSEESLLLLYLRARKHRPDHAWETLKRKAEVSFDQYPEVFAARPASFHEEFQEVGLWGILKSKDQVGRRVICIHGRKWNTVKYPVVDTTTGFIKLLDKLLYDDDSLKNGIVVVANCEQMGLIHAKQMGLSAMLRLINCLWSANPLRIKAVYFVNFPFFLLFLYELIKPFFPKKLKERFHLTTSSKKFSELHANVDPNVLPKYLGGMLEYDDAFEFVEF